jgi:uncharacterized membrane protein YqjE
MDVLMENLVIMLPIILIVFALGIAALIHVLKHPHYRFGNKIMWVVVVMLVQIIGPLVYFVFGRGEE